jgi:hypothetical protein
MNTPTPRTDEWETYCDEWYYHMWRLRRKTERGWHDGFHIQKGDEAKGLCDILNNLEAELTAVTEQRDRLAEALRSIKNELGVPQPEYPAPVANAVKIADEALQSLTNPNEL